MQRTLTIDYSDEVLLALRCSPEQFSEEAKLLVAVKLYELGRLSSGAAAKLADILTPLFLMKLADYGVDAFHLTQEDLQQDLASARRFSFLLFEPCQTVLTFHRTGRTFLTRYNKYVMLSKWNGRLHTTTQECNKTSCVSRKDFRCDTTT